MSLRKIRRRLSQTFRFSAEDSLAALAENSSLADGSSDSRSARSRADSLCLAADSFSRVFAGADKLSNGLGSNQKLSLSHSRILDSFHLHHGEFHNKQTLKKHSDCFWIFSEYYFSTAH